MKKILLAEDNEYCGSLLTHFLGKKGFEVIHRNDGASAIFAAKEEQPDLILLNVLMPGYSGIDLVRIMRKEEAFRDVPIFLLSFLSKESSITPDVERLIDSYIMKPFDPYEVLDQIEEALKKRGTGDSSAPEM
jgi:DNA-binding response OmpR family regulator